jgi:hypothetical protein
MSPRKKDHMTVHQNDEQRRRTKKPIGMARARFTPTSASWINLVERWVTIRSFYSLLSSRDWPTILGNNLVAKDRKVALEGAMWKPS